MLKALYPGSFDPVTNGHINIAKRASELVDQLTIAVYDAPPKRLLFDCEQRVALFQDAVSHLPNAKRVAPDATNEELKGFLTDSDQPIVVYCAVGYRSGKMARRIQGLGHTNVYNLEGAIFAWATEGNALEGGDKVHPYSAFGRRMLADKLEAD